MREFMDYVHSAFYKATGWSADNSYAALNQTPDGAHSLSLPWLRSMKAITDALQRFSTFQLRVASA